MLAAEEDAFDVHGVQRAPFVQSRLSNRLGKEKPGIVDKDVETAERFLGAHRRDLGRRSTLDLRQTFLRPAPR